MVSSLFSGVPFEPGINNTLITLVPKVERPSTVKEFRPISLCSVAYKVVTKVIANRLKHLMPLLIRPYQSSFIKGRNITDNIIVAQEVIHSMKKKQGKKGWIAIKVDLEKAFDKLDWSFIKDTLADVGLPVRLINVIMHCISSTTMKILWNGEVTDAFSPTRGIRQGDPLSPYIFVLCIERLSQAIEKEVEEKRWETIKLGRNGPDLSHLFFADDLVLFSGTSSTQLQRIKTVLEAFCAASGQIVSQSKTRIFFSKNIPNQMADQICCLLQFQKTEHLGKYLGVPLIHARVTKDTYSYLIEKVQQKLSGWKAKTLSLAGRITLAKSVLYSIPYYTMQTSLLPATCIQSLEKIIRKFIWGVSGSNNKPSLLNWNDFCQPMSRGGCGLKKLQFQNYAFLSKLAFGLINKPSQLWVKVLKAKYNWPNKGSYKFKTAAASHTWRSIAKVWDETELNLAWKIGNGKTIRFWSDTWLEDCGPLEYRTFADIPEEDCSATLQEFVDSRGQWSLDQVQHLLPIEIIQLIQNVTPPSPSSTEDSCYWAPNANKNFSVASAYNKMQEESWRNYDSSWKWVWQWPGMQRVRTFLWLAMQNRLLTNMERNRRGMTADTACKQCQAEEENLDHIFRSCPIAHQCWTKLLPATKLHIFLHQPFEVWLKSNLNPRTLDIQWRLLFGTVLWKLWDNRNKNIFLNESLSSESLLNLVFVSIRYTTKAKGFESIIKA